MGPGPSVVARVLENPRLRRIELGFVLFALGEYGVWVSVTVYAFQHGGTGNAALIAALQLLPAAIVAPLLARITDQRGGLHMLLVGYVLQAAAIIATAVAMLAQSPTWAVYLGAVVAASAVTVTRPAQASALASQVDRSDELTAASVLNGWADSGALLGGPALAGVMIGIDGSGLAVGAFGIGLLTAAFLVLPATLEATHEVVQPPREGGTPGLDDPELAEVAARIAEPGTGWLRSLASGPVLAVLGVMTAQYVVLGATDVLVVVLAVHTLSLSASFAGYLDAAFGVGSVLGAAASLRLVGTSSLARPLCLFAVAWSVSYALLGSFPTLATALCLLGFAGLSRSVVDTAGRALLVRVTPLSRVGRLFGILEGMTSGALAVGALLVPVFFALGGVQAVMIAIGVLLATAVVLPLGGVRAADQRAPAIDGLKRLHEHPLFARLALPSLEELARDMSTLRVTPGTQIVVQGNAGNTFYLIAEGEFGVTIDGRAVRRLQPGEGFGEIALLRDVPRTATVTADSQAVLYALGRGPFLNAMGASPPKVSLPWLAQLDGSGGLEGDPEASGTVPA